MDASWLVRGRDARATGAVGVGKPSSESEAAGVSRDSGFRRNDAWGGNDRIGVVLSEAKDLFCRVLSFVEEIATVA